VWDNCEFYINKDISECDYWVVYDNLNNTETTLCDQHNTILITAEPPSVKRYSKDFLKQFHTVVTCQSTIKRPETIIRQQSLIWMAGVTYDRNERRWVTEDCLGYDELKENKQHDKENKVCIITSNKTITKGHQLRLDFVMQLKEALGDRLDIFGHGFSLVGDKYEVFSKYRYVLVIENSYFNDYWTEKLSDAYLSDAYPIYYGCPNIKEYFSPDAFTEIDITKPEAAISKIRELLDGNVYEQSVAALKVAKTQVLDQYNLFAMVADLVKNRPVSAKVPTTIQPQQPGFLSKMKRLVFKIAGIKRKQ